jgi:hypothetical protein
VNPLPATLAIPPTIAHFRFADVDWQNGNLRALLQLLSACSVRDKDGGCRLDISGICQTEEEWAAFDEFLTTYRAGSVGELVYDRNRLTRAFLIFVNRAPVLRSLSINGCLREDDEFLPELCRFFRRNRMLEEIHIRGIGECVLSASMRHVLEALSSSRQVVLLDLRDQEMGFCIFEVLQKFFNNNRSVEEIFLDGNTIIDIQSFEALLVEFGKRNTRLILHSPTKDLLSLFEVNNIAPSNAERLNRLICKLAEYQNTRPFSSTRIPTTCDSNDPSDVVYDIRHSYLEDMRWKEALNFTPCADEMTHYEILDTEFALDRLLSGLKR